MTDEIITHGLSEIWDMEIDEYKEVYLDDFYTDTIIDFSHLYCEEPYPIMYGLQRYKEHDWCVSIPLSTEIDKKKLEDACYNIKKNCKFLIDYNIPDGEYSEPVISVLINKNMSIYDAFNFAETQCNAVVNYVNSIFNSKLSEIVKQTVINKLPIYSRAMKKVELELSNFSTDDLKNKSKIVEICSRVKSLESIEEKVYRKKISQFDIFEKFDDIAGVRCTCEFLDDVYEVLNYIKQNPLFHVQNIEDKIDNPSIAGYRGIHIIVTTKVYYQGVTYDNIKVEIQLRTAFQNAWSMKTHQLTYKHETDIPQDISDIMRKMSNSLNEADKAAQKIKEKLRENNN